jgi:ubiquinone/menaquinone biosynthesis C-methylase UbiE
MFPSKLTDRRYLLDQQYRSAANLKARLQIHERFSTNRYDWFLWMFDQIELPAAANILEMGCGPGSLWELNATRLPGAWKIYLTDLSTGMVKQARQALSITGRPFSFSASDAEAIPFPNASFEAVIANHMLYHVPAREKAFAEIRRVLKPGGRLYAATNGKNHMRELWEMVADFVPGLDSGVRDTPFSLENGVDQLSRWFSEVSTRQYDNALLVTEAAPLVEYVLSMSINATGDVSKQAKAFSEAVQEKIDRDGSIRIGKEVGVFVAEKR